MHRYEEYEKYAAKGRNAGEARRSRCRRVKRIRLTIILLLLVIIGIFVQNRIFASGQSNTYKKKGNAAASGSLIQSSEEKQISADWKLLLVNATHPVPENFSIETTPLINGQAVDKRIYQDLQNMMDAARAEGLEPLICSSYRTMEKQTSLYNAQVQSCLNQGYSREEAQKQAAIWVAPPGTSEHQLGLAVDIVAASYQLLDEEQEKTPEQKWLMKHCAEYGFVLRYPTNKSDITGIGYEPWHYRYVGKEAAKEMMGRRICLEEYLEGR